MSIDKLPVTAIVFTKNEQANIEDCLNSLSSFSEVVVVDSMSIDGTIRIATELGAKVVNFKWNGCYPKKRQWTLNNVNFTNDWILFIDADERVTPNLCEEINNFIVDSSSQYSAGCFRIDYYFAGRKLKYGQQPKKVVLLNVKHARYPIVDDLAASGMGELEGHYQPIIDGKVKLFANRIKHNDRDPIATWMTRHVNYAKWEAYLINHNETKKNVDRAKGKGANLFHKLPARPLVFFFYCYFIKLGFLDGRMGFNYAFAKSWYYWLSDLIAREEVAVEKF